MRDEFMKHLEDNRANARKREAGEARAEQHIKDELAKSVADAERKERARLVERERQRDEERVRRARDRAAAQPDAQQLQEEFEDYLQTHQFRSP